MTTGRRRFLSLLPSFGLLVLVVGFVITAPACTPLVAPPSSVPEPAVVQLPMWEVRHDGSTVYLLGAVHLLRPEVYPLHDAIYEAFDASELVAFELDVSDVMASLPVMMQRGMYGDGRTLRDVLPAELLADVQARSLELGLPFQAVESMKPWMAAMTLSSMMLQAGGFEAAAGIDMHFHERAEEAGKTVIGLETMEEQIDVFEELSTEAQIAFLRSTIEQLDEVVAQLDATTALWQRGEAEAIAAMLTESLEAQPQLMERLLYERNRNWIPAIEAMLAAPETAIVVVGMGHLVGEGSVVDLLRARGYEVTQVRATAVGP